MLLIKQKGKSSLLNKERKPADIANMFGKNESFIRGIVKKDKEICASLAVTPQTANVSHSA